MPAKSLKPCCAPACGQLTSTRFCARHGSYKDKHRETAAKRGYGHRWQKARAVFLKQYPLCAMCKDEGRIVPATVVDHVIPHKGDTYKFWDSSNWQPLCKTHHDSTKQRMERGGVPRGCDLNGNPLNREW